MIKSDEHWLEVATLFSNAAVEAGDWSSALSALADACGGQTGELIGVGADTAVPFNWITRVDPIAFEEFIHINGDDPTINPRVRIGLRAPILTYWHDAAVSTTEELRRNFAYADWRLLSAHAEHCRLRGSRP